MQIMQILEPNYATKVFLEPNYANYANFGTKLCKYETWLFNILLPFLI
jgi:hypothetical protein